MERLSKSLVKFSFKYKITSTIFFRCSVAVLAVMFLVSFTAISASAETSLVPVTITASDWNAIFINEISRFEVILQYNSGSGGILYNLNDINDIYHINSDSPQFSFSFAGSPDESTFPFILTDDVFYFYLPFVLAPANGYSLFSFDLAIALPFQYYLTNGLSNNFLNVDTFYFGNLEVSDLFLGTADSSGSDLSSIFSYSGSISDIRFDVDEPLLTLYNRYPAFQSFFTDGFPNSKKQVSTFLLMPSDFPDLNYYIGFGSELLFNIGGNEPSYSVNQSSMPCMLGLHEVTVYVQEEIASTVEDYLDAIAGSPTPENQQKIDDLKQQIQEIEENLKEQADNLQVEIPDISDVESSLPDELTQGNELVSNQVLSPILNIQFVTVILIGVFVILSIKLFLFGSGPH